MKKRIRLSIVLFALLFFFVGCASTSTSISSSFYEEWLTPEQITEDCFLKEGEEPKVYYSSDINSDIDFLRSKFYWIVGMASYNGPADASLNQKVVNLCKEKKAQIGIYGYQYTDTRNGVYSLYGGGVSSYSIKRYDYTILLFAPMPQDLVLSLARIGISYNDLSTTDRKNYQRNTGARIYAVYEDTPAFYANLSIGDVIIAVNNHEVLSSSDLTTILNQTSPDVDVTIKYIRNGVEKSALLRPIW